MNNPDFISIVIVSWNGKRWLEKCLGSLSVQTCKNFEIILVDNGSVDGSREFLRDNYPEVKIVWNKNNFGFGLANNIGVKHSRGNIICFLNNDTELFPDALERMLKFKKDTGNDIVGPRLLNSEKKDQLQGKYLQIDVIGFPGGPSSNLFYIEGCALMINKEDFLKLGGFDEKCFMYGEDIDLCWRAHLYGMKMDICEEAKVIHFGGGSSQKTQFSEDSGHATSYQRRFWVESHTLRALLKNYSSINLLWAVPLFFVQNSGESLIYLLTGNFKMFAVIWKAFSWNLKNLPDTIRKRKIVQKSRKIGDREILMRMCKGFYKWKAFRVIGMPKFK